MEKAATLPKKFDRETARGVRCAMRRIGITGYGAQYDSTITNNAQNAALASSRPLTTG